MCQKFYVSRIFLLVCRENLLQSKVSIYKYTNQKKKSMVGTDLPYEQCLNGRSRPIGSHEIVPSDHDIRQDSQKEY